MNRTPRNMFRMRTSEEADSLSAREALEGCMRGDPVPIQTHHTDYMYVYNGTSWVTISQAIRMLSERGNVFNVLNHAHFPAPPPPAPPVVDDDAARVDDDSIDLDSIFGSDSGDNEVQVAAPPHPPEPRADDPRCSTCFDADPQGGLLTLECGGVFCHECFNNMVRTALPTFEYPKCMCNGTHHDIKCTEKAFMALPTPTRQLWTHALRKRKDMDLLCPRCNTAATPPIGAERYFCLSETCYNPPYGYCTRCKVGITSDEPHACVDEEDERLFLQYLRRNAISPCPRCGNAAQKMRLDHCNHMTCVVCDATGSQYKFCAACGHVFHKVRGSFVYQHECRTDNMYHVDRRHLESIYTQHASRRRRTDAAGASGSSA